MLRVRFHMLLDCYPLDDDWTGVVGMSR
jgi:hypothetical protein